MTGEEYAKLSPKELRKYVLEAARLAFEDQRIMLEKAKKMTSKSHKLQNSLK
jgi:hypothetical protein